MFVLPSAKCLADRIPDVHIQPGDQSALFQNRNKLIWRDQSALRMNPSNQSFHAGDFAGTAVAFWLQVKDKFAIWNTIVDFMQNALLFFERFHHGCFKIADALAELSLQGRSCNLSIITHGTDGALRICDRIYTDDRKKALHLLLVLDIIAYSLKNKSDQSVIIGKEQKKIIISEIANGVMITVLNTFEIVCNVFQKPISGLLSIPVIEQLEMLQINGGDAPVFWRVLVESDTYLLKKTVSGKQAGQRIQCQCDRGQSGKCLVGCIFHSCTPLAK